MRAAGTLSLWICGFATDLDFCNDTAWDGYGFWIWISTWDCSLQMARGFAGYLFTWLAMTLTARSVPGSFTCDDFMTLGSGTTATRGKQGRNATLAADRMVDVEERSTRPGPVLCSFRTTITTLRCKTFTTLAFFTPSNS